MHEFLCQICTNVIQDKNGSCFRLQTAFIQLCRKNGMEDIIDLSEKDHCSDDDNSYQSSKFRMIAQMQSINMNIDNNNGSDNGGMRMNSNGLMNNFDNLREMEFNKKMSNINFSSINKLLYISDYYSCIFM